MDKFNSKIHKVEEVNQHECKKNPTKLAFLISNITDTYEKGEKVFNTVQKIEISNRGYEYLASFEISAHRLILLKKEYQHSF